MKTLASALAAPVVAFALAGNLHAAIITYAQNSPDPFTASTYTGAEDVWLLTNGGSAATDQNTGGDARFIAGGFAGGGIRHGLMRFNLSTLAGQYSSIESVTLRLFWNSSVGAADTVQVYAVSAANANWVEGTQGTGVTSQPGQSTWSHKLYNTTSWAGSAGASTAGTDYGSTLLASNAYTGAESAGSAFDLTFTDPSIIDSWLGPNGGILVRTATQLNQAQFRSSEFAGFEPQLLINYTAVPEPSSFALVAVIAGGGAWWKRRRSQPKLPAESPTS